MTKLLGLELHTDYSPLVDFLRSPMGTSESLFERLFPGFLEAVISGGRELEAEQARPSTVMYFSFRVQVWAQGYDVDPSSIRRVIPAGLETEFDDDAPPSVH